MPAYINFLKVIELIKKFINKYQYQISSFAIIACGIFLCLEIFRDVQREGDFGGYIEAGQLAWDKAYIYSAHRNTWPPFMSIASIPLHWLNSISFYGLRLVWLLGIVGTYWLIFKWTFNRLFSKRLVIKLKSTVDKEISLTDLVFLVPFLLSFRIFIEEVSNLQVNVFILGLCLFAFHLYEKNKKALSGAITALVIATKVYPIILIPFFIFKKKIKMLAYVIAGLFFTHICVLFYFGFDSTVLYSEWYTKQVSNGLQCIHLNQSLWSLVCGLFSGTSRFQDFFFNISSLQIDQTKLITLSIIGVIGFWIAWKFYNSKNQQDAYLHQYLIVLSLVPIFSPLAWKCYFVFLVPVTIALYYKLKGTSTNKWLILPLMVITFSSELFIGNTFSDYTEAIGFITISSLAISMLATNQLLKEEVSHQ